MKKFISAVLALVMTVSLFTTASAATMSDMLTTYGIDNPFDLGTLPVKVSAKKTGDEFYSTSGLGLLTSKDVVNAVGVDYLAELDMTRVRDMFDKTFVALILADPEALSDFEAGIVTTDVTVTISYPKETLRDETALLTAGSMNNPTFVEVGSRTFSDLDADTRAVTIKYKNTDNLTVSELYGDDSHLSDIAFTLENAIKYNTDGYHKVQVSMEGSTTISFANSASQVILYNGGSFHIASIAVDHVLEVIPAVPATCTTSGLTEGVFCKTHKGYDCPIHGREHTGYDCGINGTFEQKPIAPLAHKINNELATVIVNKVEPTCTEKGIEQHWVCTLCKIDFADANATQPTTHEALAINALGHDSTISVAGRAATCTMDGLEAASLCSRCGFKTGGKIIDKLGHNIVNDAAIAATCTTAGKTAGKHCTRCDYGVEQVDVAALGHSFGEWVEVTAATESTPGLLERTCTRGCGETQTQTIPPLPPSHVCSASDALTKVTPATCDTPGSKQEYCECGQPVGDPIAIPATGHSLTEVAEKAATCTETGISKHYKCSTCGKLYRDAQGREYIQSAETPINIDNHGTDNIIVIPASLPSCEADGWTEGTRCGKCNTAIKKQDRILKSHTWEYIPAKAASCETSGVVKHWHCKVCNKDYADDKITEMSVSDYTLKPLGHIWGNVRVTIDSTEQTEGSGEKVCMRDPSHSETITIAKKDHIHNETVYKLVRAKTCTEDGLEEKVYTCCNDTYTGEDKYRTIAAGHVLVDVPAKAPTCRLEGIKAHKYCAVCGKKWSTPSGEEITEVVAGKLDHHFGGNISSVPGEIVRECTHCGEIIKVKSNTDKAKGKTKDESNVKVKGEREDALTERDHKEAESNDQKLKVESEMTIDETGLSNTLEQKIQNKEQTVEEKVVLDIVLKSVNTFVDKNDETIVYDQKKEIIEETEEFFEIEIQIPESMRNQTDYRVYRMHKGVHTENDIITETENFFGEKITSITATTVTIKVRKFSEYVLVAYTEQQPEIVYPDPTPSSPSGGGGGGSSYVVKFNTNGGVLVGSVKVNRGETIAELPVPTRDGYVFAGWYTDSAYKNKFDITTPVVRPITLYAKWIDINECRGIEEDHCPCLNFYDLDPTMWYHKAVDYVLNNKMMIGVAETQFAPDWDVTRAMLVTVLWRAEGKPSGKQTTFTDLEEGLYYVDAVQWATENGVVTGHSDEIFAPNDAITREQFAAIMYRYAKIKGYDVSVGENTNILSYTDYNMISEYAIPAMQYTAGSGLISGRTETTLNPKDNTTRAEMATILYRFYTELK